MRLVPPEHGDEPDRGIREGDDGDFLFKKIWTPAHALAEESVGTLDANLIADKIMDTVGEIRREENPAFLDDDGQRRAYLLRAVVNEMKGTHKANQLHAKLHALYAHLIEANTTGRPFPAPDARQLAELREDEKSELMEYVSREVDDLPPKCHEVVYLTYVEDLWPREIEEKLHIKADSVQSHLRRAHKRVRQAVRQYLIDHLPENRT